MRRDRLENVITVMTFMRLLTETLLRPAPVLGIISGVEMHLARAMRADIRIPDRMWVAEWNRWLEQCNVTEVEWS